ncbi:hypothetical protein F7725_021211, partial [Dissostichus mawsoni]
VCVCVCVCVWCVCVCVCVCPCEGEVRQRSSTHTATDMNHLLKVPVLAQRAFSSSATRQLKNKVPDAQKIFQEDNGLPVHIKGGVGDVLMYRATMALTIGVKRDEENGSVYRLENNARLRLMFVGEVRQRSSTHTATDMNLLLKVPVLAQRAFSSSATRQLKNKVPDAQKIFQEDNGLPVHIKGGVGDVLMYRATMALTIGVKRDEENGSVYRLENNARLRLMFVVCNNI